MSALAEKTAAKYRGDVARGYEGKRVDQVKWKAEDRIVRALLEDVPSDNKLLDIPCGTGRFFAFYGWKGFDVTAIDISEDMLSVAERSSRMTERIKCSVGNIFDTKLPDKSFDVAVSIRIMNLIEADDMIRALKELQRVTCSTIIFNLRVWHEATRFRRPQRMETLKAALLPGWRIADDREIHEPDFRMFRLCAG